MFTLKVDLLLATTVEGVSVWNWQQVVTTIWDTIVHFGVETLRISFGETTDNLIEYNQVCSFIFLQINSWTFVSRLNKKRLKYL